MRIALVVAMDKNRLIGVDNHLPWRLPDDMEWFKRVTMGKPVVMGRKTYESIPTKFRPLAGRTNIILTRDPNYQSPGCMVVHSVAEALQATGEAEEVIIAGGAELYTQLLPQASRLYLTLVNHTFLGDTYFPPFDLSQWHETWSETHPPNGRHPYPFRWVILDR